MSMDKLFIFMMLALMAVYFLRVIKGPSIWDRLHGLCLISTKVLLIVILFASFNELAYLLDIAIAFALLGFIGTVFISLYFLDMLRGRE